MGQLFHTFSASHFVYCLENSSKDEDSEYIVITGSRDHTVKVWALSLAATPQDCATLSSEKTFSIPSHKAGTHGHASEYDQQATGTPAFSSNISRQADNDSDESVDDDPTDNGNFHALEQVEDSVLDEQDEDYQSEDSAYQEDIPTDSCLFQFEGHSGSVRALAAKGSIVVSGSYDHSVAVWSLESGKRLHQLLGHEHKVYSVVYDNDLNLIASGSMDASVRIWNSINGQCLHVLTGRTRWVNTDNVDAFILALV